MEGVTKLEPDGWIEADRPVMIADSIIVYKAEERHVHTGEVRGQGSLLFDITGEISGYDVRGHVCVVFGPELLAQVFYVLNKERGHGMGPDLKGFVPDVNP